MNIILILLSLYIFVRIYLIITYFIISCKRYDTNLKSMMTSPFHIETTLKTIGAISIPLIGEILFFFVSLHHSGKLIDIIYNYIDDIGHKFF